MHKHDGLFDSNNPLVMGDAAAAFFEQGSYYFPSKSVSHAATPLYSGPGKIDATPDIVVLQTPRPINKAYQCNGYVQYLGIDCKRCIFASPSMNGQSHLENKRALTVGALGVEVLESWSLLLSIVYLTPGLY